MTVYVDENYEVYTEENINDIIIEKLEECNYEGLFQYLNDNYTERELFGILPSTVQEEIFNYLKANILQEEFYESKIDISPCPYKDYPCLK